MSGHSHWSSIKHKKGAEDAKRSKIFSKASRVISVAARDKGGDPEANAKLKIAIEQAKTVNMPKENIERAIKRGTGELEGEKLEFFAFEALGPSGIVIIIEGITDNKNRTLGDLKQILNLHNGKLANEGSVKWMFDRKGVILIPNSQFPIPKDEVELFIIETGAEDIKWRNDFLEITTKPEELDKVKKNLEDKKFIIESASLDWVAKEEIEVANKENLEKLFEALDDNDAVQNIYSNLKL